MKRQNSTGSEDPFRWGERTREPLLKTRARFAGISLRSEATARQALAPPFPINCRRWFNGLCVFMLIATGSAAGLPADWQYEQSFNIAAAGLVKLSLPAETLDVARPGLEDLRLYDSAGGEVPYLIDRPAPVVRVVQNLKSFHISLNPSNTVIILETGLTQPLDGVTLETPAANFLKPARVEGSTDLRRWQMLESGQPIFRQPSGASRLHIAFPAGAWPWLRLSIDDRRTPAIPLPARASTRR